MHLVQGSTSLNGPLATPLFRVPRGNPFSGKSGVPVEGRPTITETPHSTEQFSKALCNGKMRCRRDFQARRSTPPEPPKSPLKSAQSTFLNPHQEILLQNPRWLFPISTPEIKSLFGKHKGIF
ncbi:hypothetical protein AVEN_73872-1 [Araneus ventricosus]|uniref:Uncharacterized protein n=1 Tax=Araneus ventricosus TaxID=182803 RepID=A0A4Y2G0W7_ARAVE|nr:hypothetical protein AVEN_73872-1 [Araneus ventricosus]